LVLLLLATTTQLGCQVGQPQWFRQPHLAQAPCRHADRQGPSRRPVGGNVLGDLARTIDRLVVGVDYTESLPAGEPILGNLPEPLPPPASDWSPRESRELSFQPTPLAEPAPDFVEPAPGRVERDCPPRGTEQGPPGRFFPVPVRPVFSPQSPLAQF